MWIPFCCYTFWHQILFRTIPEPKRTDLLPKPNRKRHTNKKQSPNNTNQQPPWHVHKFLFCLHIQNKHLFWPPQDLFALFFFLISWKACKISHKYHGFSRIVLPTNWCKTFPGYKLPKFITFSNMLNTPYTLSEKVSKKLTSIFISGVSGIIADVGRDMSACSSCNKYKWRIAIITLNQILDKNLSDCTEFGTVP